MPGIFRIMLALAAMASLSSASAATPDRGPCPRDSAAALAWIDGLKLVGDLKSSEGRYEASFDPAGTSRFGRSAMAIDVTFFVHSTGGVSGVKKIEFLLPGDPREYHKGFHGAFAAETAFCREDSGAGCFWPRKNASSPAGALTWVTLNHADYVPKGRVQLSCSYAPAKA